MAAGHGEVVDGGGDVRGDGPGGPLFWASAVAGASLVAAGVLGALSDPGATHPANLARWVVGAGVAHDAVFAPLVVAVGWISARWLPASVRGPVRVGLALSAVVVAVSWPAVRGYGRNPLNPSLLPLDYARNLCLALVALWSAVALAVVVRLVRGRA